MNYYEALGVPRDATADQIKKAFHEIARKYHPDRNPGDALAEDTFKRANEAYATLSDSERRTQYDIWLEYGGDDLAGKRAFQAFVARAKEGFSRVEKEVRSGKPLGEAMSKEVMRQGVSAVYQWFRKAARRDESRQGN